MSNSPRPPSNRICHPSAFPFLALLGIPASRLDVIRCSFLLRCRTSNERWYFLRRWPASRGSSEVEKRLFGSNVYRYGRVFQGKNR
jgi:hypothetical protein